MHKLVASEATLNQEVRIIWTDGREEVGYVTTIHRSPSETWCVVRVDKVLCGIPSMSEWEWPPWRDSTNPYVVYGL